MEHKEVVHILESRLLDWKYDLVYNLSPLDFYMKEGKERLNSDIDAIFKRTREKFIVIGDHSISLGDLKDIKGFKKDIKNLEDECTRLEKRLAELEPLPKVY